MDIFLSKLLPLLVYPVGLTWLLLGTALLIRRPRVRRTLVAVAFALLWLAGTRWVSFPLAYALERRYPPPTDLPAGMVAVVLGGGTEPLEAPRRTPEANGAVDRVLYAARLYHQGKARVLLLSGGRIPWLEGMASTPAEEMAALLHELGVPDEALWLEPDSLNTYQNAVNSKALLQQHGVERVLLVTSALHMPRAVYLFEQQAIEVIPAPTDYLITDAMWERLWHGPWSARLLFLIPNASNLNLTTAALKEYLGLAVYRLRGDLSAAQSR